MALFLKYKYLLIVLLFGLLSVVSLFNPGIPPTHDGEYHVLRFQQFYKVLSEGVVYPRWAPDFNNGFGIPLFSYVYPLPNYMASLFHLLGFSFIDSFKLNMVVASILGSFFFYLWSRKFWGDLGAVVSSIFYTFSPYHFLDIYVRSSVGEVWSLGLFPGLLWAYVSFQRSKESKFFLLSVVFLALLVLSHNILALVFFSFFLLYSFLLISDLKDKIFEIKKLLLIIVLGLGLSAPFWLPALLETNFVVGLKTSLPTDHFPVLYKLIYSSWGYGFSGVGGAGQMSFQIGIANLFVILISILLVFYLKKRKDSVFFIISFFLFLFLITPFSSFLWKTVPFASFVQFPWRLLSVLILISSYLAGGLVRDNSFYNNRKSLKITVAILLIFMSVGLSFRYARAPYHHLRDDKYYLTRSNFTDGTNSPGDAFNTAWLSKVPQKTKQKIESKDKSAVIRLTESKSNSYIFNVYLSKDSEVLINTAFFPGWIAIIDNKKHELFNNEGRMMLKIPKGNHIVHVYLVNTFVQNISYLIFVLSILLLIMSLYRSPDIIKK